MAFDLWLKIFIVKEDTLSEYSYWTGTQNEILKKLREENLNLEDFLDNTTPESSFK